MLRSDINSRCSVLSSRLCLNARPIWACALNRLLVTVLELNIVILQPFRDVPTPWLVPKLPPPVYLAIIIYSRAKLGPLREDLLALSRLKPC